MARYGACLALAVAMLLVLGVVRAQEEAKPEEQEYYPLSWAKFDIKPIVDNDRLFTRYKDCLLSEKIAGCPKEVQQLRKILPEVIQSTCKKCLPEHIEKVKEALEYICQKRRADFDEVRNAKDPSGQLQTTFQEKYGKINCPNVP